jgi:hypothetical protein
MLAPRCFNNCNKNIPKPPVAPLTNMLVCELMLPIFCNAVTAAVPTTGIEAAWGKLISAGFFQTKEDGTVTYSAETPSRQVLDYFLFSKGTNEEARAHALPACENYY